MFKKKIAYQASIEIKFDISIKGLIFITKMSLSPFEPLPYEEHLYFILNRELLYIAEKKEQQFVQVLSQVEPYKYNANGLNRPWSRKQYMCVGHKPRSSAAAIGWNTLRQRKRFRVSRKVYDCHGEISFSYLKAKNIIRFKHDIHHDSYGKPAVTHGMRKEIECFCTNAMSPFHISSTIRLKKSPI